MAPRKHLEVSSPRSSDRAMKRVWYRKDANSLPESVSHDRDDLRDQDATTERYAEALLHDFNSHAPTVHHMTSVEVSLPALRLGWALSSDNLSGAAQSHTDKCNRKHSTVDLTAECYKNSHVHLVAGSTSLLDGEQQLLQITGHTAKPLKHKASVFALQLVMAAVCVAWMLASSATILTNQHLMVACNFPYPLTITSLGMVFSSVAATIGVHCCAMGSSRAQASSGEVLVNSSMTVRGYIANVVPVALLMGLSFASGNAAFLFLTLSYIQMLKALAPVATLAVAVVLGLETPSISMVASVVVISLGVGMASFGQGSRSVLGLSLMMLSVVTDALRVVMTQALMAGRNYNPIESLMYIAPACSLMLLAMAAYWEIPAMLSSGGLLVLAAHPLAVLTASCAGFLVNLLSYCVIQLASGVMLKVLGTMKDAALVWVGFAFLKEVITSAQVLGYLLSLSGFIWYNVARAMAPTSSSGTTVKQPPQEKVAISAQKGACTIDNSTHWTRHVARLWRTTGPLSNVRSTLRRPSSAVLPSRCLATLDGLLGNSSQVDGCVLPCGHVMANAFELSSPCMDEAFSGCDVCS